MEQPGTSAYEQGMAALRGGAAQQAVQLLSQAAEADPRHADASAMLGVALGQLGRYAEAGQALRRALALQPQNAVYHYNLGMALEAGGDRSGAADAYRAALGINPNYAAAQARLQALGPVAPPPAASTASPSVPPAAPPPIPAPQPPPPASAPYGHVAVFPAPVAMAGTGMDVGQAFGRRLGARLVDAILVGAVGGVLFALSAGLGFAIDPAVGALFVLGWYGLYSFLPMVYYCWMQAARGQTLGQMALGIRLVDAHGQTPGLGMVIARQFAMILSAMPCLLGNFWMLWDPRQQTWHDKLTDTYVIRA